jgi:hypothetical protein
VLEKSHNELAPASIDAKPTGIAIQWLAGGAKQTTQQPRASKILEIELNLPVVMALGWVYFSPSRDPLASAPKKSNLPEFPPPFLLLLHSQPQH